MMEEGLLNGFKKRWQQTLYVECLFYAVGVGTFVYLLSQDIGYGILGFVLTFGVSLAVIKPWKISVENAIAYVDAHVPQAGFSSGLLVLPQDQLTNLSKLQRYRIATQLQPIFSKLQPPHHIMRATLVMFGLILLGLAARFVGTDLRKASKGHTSPQEIQFAPLDSLSTSVAVPTLENTMITINQPDYTGIPNTQTTNPNLKAVVGSIIIWQLEFKGEVSEVTLDCMGELFPLSKSKGRFTLRQKLDASGFYSFAFKDSEGNGYVTDLYSLEAIKDESSVVEIQDLDQYSYFEFDQDKRLPLNTIITDDFGVADAFIVATVSKGTGESVKFREETLRFDGTFPKGKKRLQLQKQLDLDELNMDPGDELYFYVEAMDNKSPTSNISRSETYFAVIRDTITDDFAVESTLGVDLMPDYFRSQRQLIIDTEKLIKDKPNLSEYDFKFKSNELGFDQKSLRLKYGQFMGDETEMQTAPGQVSAAEDDHDHEEERGEDDPLEGYSHKHDTENEHNLVEEHDHGEESEEEEEDPLHDYLHDHGDPEASTLFEKSLKAKLRDALSIMWDAELYLRLYQPEKSLPYQYQALKIIQEIKNSARIYVHRIGFDPPPIKEEKRLTGDIKDISNVNKEDRFDHQLSFSHARNAISRLEELVRGQNEFTEQDATLLQNAGNELAEKAVVEPLKYLKVLQGLRDLNKVSNRTMKNYKTVRKNLLSVLPKVENNPGKENRYVDDINALYLKELESYD